MPENTSNVLSIPIKTIQSKFRGLCWQARGRRVGPAGNVTGLEFAEVEFVASDAEVFDDVRNDAARHIAGMPRKGDEAIRAEGIRVMPVAAGVAKMFATDFAEATFQLAAVECGVFAHRSGGEDKLVAEGRGNGASGFKQRFQMRFGGLLKTKGGFTPVAALCVTTGQQQRFGDPHAVFILTKLHFRERNNHSGRKLTCSMPDVKEDGWPGDVGRHSPTFLPSSISKTRSRTEFQTETVFIV